jgi:dGTP triphosphohydrolase
MSTEIQEYIEYVGKHEQNLACYAIKSLDAVFIDGETTREFYKKLFEGGDQFKKNRYRWRTPFQLDRDSILYSSLFTRLSEKTQLYTGQGRVENRMTHTLKVAQITRSICRSLFLNEDLGEAIAFGHDVGHTPFAHEGERALNGWLKKKLEAKSGQKELDEISILNKVDREYKNSFKTYFTYSNDPNDDFFLHGRQSVRLLTHVRKKIPDRYFTKNTLFGIWRHSTKAAYTDKDFSYKQQIDEHTTFELGKEDASLEAQVVRFADDIAWIISDLTET